MVQCKHHHSDQVLPVFYPIDKESRKKIRQFLMFPESEHYLMNKDDYFNTNYSIPEEELRALIERDVFPNESRET